MHIINKLQKITLILILLSIPISLNAIEKSFIGVNYFGDHNNNPSEYSEVYFRYGFYQPRESLEIKVTAGYDSYLKFKYSNKLNSSTWLNFDYYPREGAYQANLEWEL